VCELNLFVGLSLTLSTHPNIHKKRGADADLRGITCYMARPMRASYIGISQQWRSSTDGNSITPAQGTSIKVKDKYLKLIALVER
jgi:catabolite regulation protein CreA